jgi:glycosyltransferase family protein
MIRSQLFRYGKPFHYLRQFIKLFLSGIYPILNFFYKMPNVESVFDTLNALVLNNKYSIVRFGDGEIIYLNDKLDLPFQKYDTRLSETYKSIFKNNHPGLLVGLPIGYHDLTTLSKEGQIFWRSQIVWHYPRFKKYLNLKSVYANSSITRLTYGFEKGYTIKGYELWKNILKAKKVLIIEGDKTRFGVGNDLLKNIDRIDRILAPKHDAFDKCDEILNYVISLNTNYDLILIALGPAAKYLVFELYKKGIPAIDIGNLDIEYEWYLRNAAEKRIAIPGKYTSEAKGGRDVGEIPDLIARKKYEDEIVAKFNT